MRTATVTYEGLPNLVQPNDTVYVGRYLAGGMHKLEGKVKLVMNYEKLF